MANKNKISDRMWRTDLKATTVAARLAFHQCSGGKWYIDGPVLTACGVVICYYDSRGGLRFDLVHKGRHLIFDEERKGLTKRGIARLAVRLAAEVAAE